MSLSLINANSVKGHNIKPRGYKMQIKKKKEKNNARKCLGCYLKSIVYYLLQTRISESNRRRGGDRFEFQLNTAS